MLTVVISVLSTLIATAIVGALALVGRARTEVARHERLVAYLGKDFRRWVSDRDRLLGHELRGITNTMAAGPTFGDLEAAELGGAKPGDEATRVASQLYSGAHVRALAEAKRRALHEYRDEAERKLREFEALVEGEGWLHRFVRRRRGLGAPRLKLTRESRDKLADWRKPATNPADATAPPVEVDDPTRRELEPELARLEQGAAPDDA